MTFDKGFVPFQITFPAVTVCNQNRVDCGRLRDLVEKCVTNSTDCDISDGIVERMKKIQTVACVSN